MKEEKAAYRQIIKSTSLFGGVQVFNILIRIIRTKFVAILLGPAGMGIAGLLNATIGLIAGFTNFGLETSAVKDISTAYGSENQLRIARIIAVVRRWVWVTGLFGAFIALLLSTWLSELTFGNRRYTYAFMWISITLLLNQLSIGQGVVLRGLRKHRYLALSSIIGSILGLITTIPLYYYYGVDGIVPGIIMTSVSSLLLTWFFAKKVKLKQIKVSKLRTIAEGRDMLKLGLVLSLGSLIGLGESYIIRMFISNIGGIEQVGLYNAGFAIINSYVGMIFIAMGTDYYPKLASVANSDEKSRIVINQQAEVALLILSPIIILCIVYINWIVLLLYSTKFLKLNDMVLWAAVGVLFKAVSWSIGFIFLAKGATKVFFWNELITNIYLLVFNVAGYYYWGLTGLGLSIMLVYLIYVIQVYVVAKIKFNFSFNREFFNIFGFQLTLTAISLLIIKLLQNPYSYILGSLVIVISIFHSYKELDKRMELKYMFNCIKDKISLK